MIVCRLFAGDLSDSVEVFVLRHSTSKGVVGSGIFAGRGQADGYLN